jgi:hypothetical protein
MNTQAIPASNTAHYQVQEKLLALNEALLASTPNMATLLRDIHRQLKADPDLVTILTEEECNIVAEGLKKQTSTELATTMAKSAPKKAMGKMQLGLDL